MERLTWRQIQKKYPDQWVALEDVIYLNDDGCNVESAVVVCAMSDDDYVNKRLAFMRAGKTYDYERTADTRGFVGYYKTKETIYIFTDAEKEA